MFSKYELYSTAQSLYCYPDTNVLRNRLNIKDAAALKEAEEEITALKAIRLTAAADFRPFYQNASVPHSPLFV